MEKKENGNKRERKRENNRITALLSDNIIGDSAYTHIEERGEREGRG